VDELTREAAAELFINCCGSVSAPFPAFFPADIFSARAGGGTITETCIGTAA
jgi:hypothetical protein